MTTYHGERIDGRCYCWTTGEDGARSLDSRCFSPHCPMPALGWGSEGDESYWLATLLLLCSCNSWLTATYFAGRFAHDVVEKWGDCWEVDEDDIVGYLTARMVEQRPVRLSLRRMLRPRRN